MSKFKVGDKVKRTGPTTCRIRKGKECEVTHVTMSGNLILDDTGYIFDAELFELVEGASKYHKYYDAIVAWAQGKTIQFLNKNTDSWTDYELVRTPEFGYGEWREKPEKSEAQIELEKLQEQIKALQEQADKLEKSL